MCPWLQEPEEAPEFVSEDPESPVTEDTSATPASSSTGPVPGTAQKVSGGGESWSLGREEDIDRTAPVLGLFKKSPVLGF